MILEHILLFKPLQQFSLRFAEHFWNPLHTYLSVNQHIEHTVPTLALTDNIPVRISRSLLTLSYNLSKRSDMIIVFACHGIGIITQTLLAIKTLCIITVHTHLTLYLLNHLCDTLSFLCNGSITVGLTPSAFKNLIAPRWSSKWIFQRERLKRNFALFGWKRQLRVSLLLYLHAPMTAHNHVSRINCVPHYLTTLSPSGYSNFNQIGHYDGSYFSISTHLVQLLKKRHIVDQ